MNDIDKMWDDCSGGFKGLPPAAHNVLKTVFYMGVCEGARESQNAQLMANAMMKVMECGLAAKAERKGETSFAG